MTRKIGADVFLAHCLDCLTKSSNSATIS